MTTPARNDLLAADAALLRLERGPLTLGPNKARATLPSELVARLLPRGESEALLSAFGRGLAGCVEAMLDAFPDNLLWDLDYLAARVLHHGRAADEAVEGVARLWSDVIALQGLFGRRGEIRFRYIHDFVYGYDWARWVAKDPARVDTGPFDPAFVRRMQRRGHELEQTIISGRDPKYPPLVGEQTRNPFRFSREPDEELGLHRTLADRGGIPVQAWDPDAVPRWDAPFAAMREQVGVEAARAAGR